MTSDTGTQGEGSGSAALLRRTPDALEAKPRLFIYEWGLWETLNGEEQQVGEIWNAAARDALDAILRAAE